MAPPDFRKITEQRKIAFREFQSRVTGTNINEQTLLATDYLNHFNEITMMLEMVPAMPEIMEEVLEWKPKTYQEHFRDSSFSDKDLAVEAYGYAPTKYRRPFENTIVQMSRLVTTCVKKINKDLAAGNPALVEVTVQNTTRILQKLIDSASANIHGSEQTLDQSEVDALLKE